VFTAAKQFEIAKEWGCAQVTDIDSQDHGVANCSTEANTKSTHGGYAPTAECEPQTDGAEFNFLLGNRRTAGLLV
jgi:hypothetical protein